MVVPVPKFRLESGHERPSGESRRYACHAKGTLMQLVRVQSEELSVHLGSYPDGGKGDRPVEALGKGAHEGGLASVRAATRVKPEQASKGEMRAPTLRKRVKVAETGWRNRPMKARLLSGVMGAARIQAAT